MYFERLALPGPIPIDRRELEAYDAAFLATRATRRRIEYFFTSTPSCLRFLFARFPEIDRLTYVDADLCFYSSCEPAFAEIADASIAVVEHRTGPVPKAAFVRRRNADFV